MIDRYTKIVLTVIAGALVYLCVVMTAFPAVQAQGTRKAGRDDHRTADRSRHRRMETHRAAANRDHSPPAGADRAQRPARPIASSSSAGKRAPHASVD